MDRHELLKQVAAEGLIVDLEFRRDVMVDEGDSVTLQGRVIDLDNTVDSRLFAIECISEDKQDKYRCYFCPDDLALVVVHEKANPQLLVMPTAEKKERHHD